MLTRMAPLLTRMARMARLLTRMTRWLADSHIIHTHVMVETISTPAVALRGDRARTGLERATGLEPFGFWFAFAIRPLYEPHGNNFKIGNLFHREAGRPLFACQDITA